MSGLAAQVQQLQGKLLADGIVDEQFLQLQELEDEANPDFLQEVCEMFFHDGEQKLVALGQLLAQDPIPWQQLDSLVHQLKGSSASTGARQISEACAYMRQLCQMQNSAALREVAVQAQQAFVRLKNEVGQLLALRQAVRSGG